MKTLRFLLCGIAILASAAIASQAKNVLSVNIGPSNALEQVLGDSWSSIDSLVIIGQATNDDLKMVRRCIYYGMTTGVDMSGCAVPGNTIPDAAFMAEFKIDETGTVQPSQQLQYFTLPNNLERINEYAFANTGLREIDYPASLTFIGEQAFAYCRSLRGDVTLNAAGCHVGQQAFVESWHITDVLIPSDAIVDNFAFYSIPLLQRLQVDDGASIGHAAFMNNMSLQTATLADRVSLGKYAFSECESLEQIRLPKLLPTIEDELFEGTPLKQIEWPNVSMVRETNDYYKINFSAFRGTQFVTVEVPEGVTNIMGGAFANNPKLEYIILPDGMIQVANSMFSNCPSLTAIYCKAISPALMNSGVDPDLCHRATLYVPKGSKQTYEARNGWKEFENIVEVEDFPNTFLDAIQTPTNDNGVYYDLRGIRVARPSAGLYIHQGKVVAIP